MVEYTGDDSGFRLQMNLLGDRKGRGLNIDFITYRNGKWMLVELLRCIKVPPKWSHPRNYWAQDKYKFIYLWQLTQKLEGDLVLVNYEDTYQEFKVLNVKAVGDSGLSTEDKLYTREEFLKFWHELNGY